MNNIIYNFVYKITVKEAMYKGLIIENKKKFLKYVEFQYINLLVLFSFVFFSVLSFIIWLVVQYEI